MNFEAFALLSGLFALAAPIAIHLWSKNTTRVIPFGTLQFLRETDTRSTKRIFPTELLLLFLRCLIVATLAVFFAKPYLSAPAAQPTVVYLLDPHDQQSKSAVIGTVPEEAPFFWLNLQHQTIAEMNPVNGDLWSGILSFSAYDSLVIFSSRKVSAFQGDRPAALPHLHWIDLPTERQTQKIRSVAKADSTADLYVTTLATATTFSWQAAKSGSPLTQTIAIYHSENYEALAQWIGMAIAAMNQSSWISWSVVKYDPDKPTNWTFWLSDETAPLPDHLIFTDTTSLAPISRIGISSYAISNHLTLDDMIQRNFPLQLERMLTKPLNDALTYPDQLAIPLSQLHADPLRAEVSPGKRSLQAEILIVLALLLLAERTISYLKTHKPA